jgi:hypothetical protein
MSFYSDNMGIVAFKKKEHYEEFKNLLKTGEWADDYNWLDENGSSLCDGSPFNDSELTVEFMGVTQRNIHRAINHLKKYDWEGQIVGASNDGCFDGWIVQHNEPDINVNLDDYAKFRKLGSPPEDDNERTTWQYEIIEQFLEDPSYEIPSSIKFIRETQTEE